MALYHGKNTQTFIGGYPVYFLVSGITPAPDRDMIPYAVQDGEEGYRHFPGLAKDTMEIEGLFDDNYLTPFNSLFTSNDGYAVMIPLKTTQGSQVLAVNESKLYDYKIKAVTTDVVRMSAKMQANDIPWEMCKLLQPFATVATSSQGTGINETASSVLGASAYLQITNLGTDDTLQIKIQHSNDDGSTDPYADLITFTTLDGSVAIRTTERKTIAVAVTIKEWVRCIWTFGGSAPYTGSFIVAWKRI